jgi:hypothetical protein
MSAEFDLQAGLDISSLSSVTKAQLMQMIAQSSPLTNRGGIIYMSGAAGALPDIANNSRFRRYLWLDTQTDPPTPKIYNVGGGTWDTLVVGAGAITNTHVNAAAAIAITKLAFGTARYIIRTNAAGNALEFITPNSIFNDNELSLARLSNSGAPANKSYLQYDSSTGNKTWQAIAFADFAAGDLMGVTKLQPSGVNSQVIATVAGTVQWAALNSLLAAGDVGLDKLSVTGATAYQVLRRNSGNTANEWATLPINRYFRIEAAGTIGAANSIATVAHGFNPNRPLLVDPFVICSTNDAGWVVGEEVPLRYIFRTTAADDLGQPTFLHYWDATNVYFLRGTGTMGILNKGTAVEAAFVSGNWKFGAYCYV